MRIDASVGILHSLNHVPPRLEVLLLWPSGLHIDIQGNIQYSGDKRAMDREAHANLFQDFLHAGAIKACFHP